MKTYSIKMIDGPYMEANKPFSVTGDSANITSEGGLVIKAGDDVVFTAAAGRWNYYQVQQSYELDKLKKAV